jgi:3-hydroxybutyryl-CoA dehydrogenase
MSSTTTTDPATDGTRRAVVVGGGTMGGGIVEVLLTAGAEVTLVEANPEVGARLTERLGGKLDADTVARLTVVPALEGAVDADIAIEAVPEDIALKGTVLAAVEAAVPETCLIASNTSSLSINELAEGIGKPGRFIGMHFFNPVPRSSLVELVVGERTAPETVEAATAWVKLLEKEQIVVRDSPGFATSRLGVAIGLEAIRMVEEGVASPEDIDRGMVLGYKFPMGPLRLTDLVGLDVRLAIAEHLASTLGPRFEPPALMREMVAAGQLGKKTGKGFFEW